MVVGLGFWVEGLGFRIQYIAALRSRSERLASCVCVCVLFVGLMAHGPFDRSPCACLQQTQAAATADEDLSEAYV